MKIAAPGLLFDLAKDPGERADLAAMNPERVAGMAALLETIKGRGRSRP